MNDKHESDTIILKRIAPGFAWLPRFLRHYLTPALVGGAIVGLGGWLTYYFNSPQKDINRVEGTVTKSIEDIQKSVAELVKQSQDTRTDVASIKATVSGMKDSEHERWERIDKVVAEDKAHARRRK